MTSGKRVCIVSDPGDAVADSAPARWAAGELERAPLARGIDASVCSSVTQAPADALCIIAGTHAGEAGAPEALALIPDRLEGRPVLRACGHDAAGLVYALLELVDRAEYAADPMAGLPLDQAITERPANAVRSVARLFVSEVEDKGWFNDREMWPEYLSMLARQRFNRFHLSLGIGYDFLRSVTDSYFLFPYPFLLSVPGYDVRAVPLSDAERDANLEMLRFISQQTVARGMRFQLGIWMHGYQWIDSPNPNYTVTGLTRQNHAAYCRDAVRLLLQQCPAISGLTFRVHGESGVEEGSYEFWKTVFEGVATCGRRVEINMHAKGMDQTMIDMAMSTGLPITISPKYWAEHLGMPYHQADIREWERLGPGRKTHALMKLSDGSRSFIRYGYGDLLREDRRWRVVHRIWPGTQRLLLWGDPTWAAAYSRAFGFCGSDGVEIMEPLSFKGRRGSGIAGGRCAYADEHLRPRWDWQKYEYTYRILGRHLYNPDCDAEVGRRWLRRRFGAGAEAMGEALGHASRILPIVTTAHCPSAANSGYWPEIYTNQSLIDPESSPYRDSVPPRIFGNVTPLDPQLFSRIDEFADELLAGRNSGRISPNQVAQWLGHEAARAAEWLGQAGSPRDGADAVEWRRWQIDIAILAGLGKFFSNRFRSGILYRIYEQTGNRCALSQSLLLYRWARDAWADLARCANGVYAPDITVGERPNLRGHWLDRLTDIDQDIAALESLDIRPAATPTIQSADRVARAIGAANRSPQRPPPLAFHHDAPITFIPGQAIELELSVDPKPSGVQVYYRHVNQAERFESAQMQGAAGQWQFTIPGSYTDSPYSLQYYFVVNTPAVSALYPGFGEDLTNMPYFVIRPTRAATDLAKRLCRP